jgi:hypothetical protein
MADFAKFVKCGFPWWKKNKKIFDKMINVQADLSAENSILFDQISTFPDHHEILEANIREIYEALKEFSDDRDNPE